jgi:hypothetical protein
VAHSPSVGRHCVGQLALHMASTVWVRRLSHRPQTRLWQPRPRIAVIPRSVSLHAFPAKVTLPSNSSLEAKTSISSPSTLDFARAVPIPSYCRRDGVLNIASRFPPPRCRARPGALLFFLPCCVKAHLCYVKANLGTSRPKMNPTYPPHSRRPLAHKRGGCVRAATPTRPPLPAPPRT